MFIFYNIVLHGIFYFFFFQAEDGIRDLTVTGVQTCALPISGLARVAAIDGVSAVADPWSTGSDALRASDGRAALAVVTVTGGLDEKAEVEQIGRASCRERV